ncbi:MAG: uracil-DNA glycosylase [Candidatus Dormiibacterota bacterium]
MASDGIGTRVAASEGPARETEIHQLHSQILNCRRCQQAGLLAHAAPVLPAPLAAGMMVVGQAPGRVEEAAGRPFSGRAGKQLFRWLAAAGLGDEEAARRVVYITSVTKCFPGPSRSGSGDRRPGPAEVELCRGHLDRQLALLQPWLILAVGQMALERFLGRLSMDLAVGRIFDSEGTEVEPGEALRAARRPLLLPLPHPSGASRWLNSPAHRMLLEQALERLAGLQESPAIT